MIQPHPIFTLTSIFQVRLLKAGSLERLVDHLAAAFLHDDVNFLSIFLATYRTFVPPTQVVDMLLERYEKLAYEEIQDTDESYSASDCEAIKVKRSNLGSREVKSFFLEIDPSSARNVDRKASRRLATASEISTSSKNFVILYQFQGQYLYPK